MAYETLIYDCLERVKETVEDALTTVPALSFVTDGDPTTMYMDCPYIAVSMAPQTGMFRSISARARGSSLPARATMRTAAPQLTIQVTLISTACWPTQTSEGKMPDPSDIEAATLAVLTDRKEVWSRLWTECQDGTLFTGILAGRDCATLGEQPTRAFGPQGLNAGSQFYLYVDLTPYPDGS
jgi:hypothetical protein